MPLCFKLAALVRQTNFMLRPLWEREAPRRLRGGWKQRLAAGEGTGEGSRPSALVVGLLLDWADGNRSAWKLQRDVSNAYEDGLRHPMVRKFASVRAGRHAQEGLRSLFSDLGVDALQTRLDGVRSVTRLLLPSTLIKLLHRDHPRAFQRRLGADSVKLRSFWETFLRRPRTKLWASRHPYLNGKAPGDLVASVPFTLHEDSGPCSKGASCNAISWSGLLGEGAEKLTQYLICSFLKVTGDSSNRVDEPAWERILRDCEEMATGIVGGQEMARDGRKLWRFILITCKADEDTKCNDWGMPHFNSPAALCAECTCDDSEGAMSWTNLSRHAAWRPTQDPTPVAWKARMRTPHHPLVRSPFCCDPFFFYFDAMHNNDCKGVSNLAMGSTLAVLLSSWRVGRTRPERLATLNAAMREWYSQRPGSHRLPKIRMSNLVDSSGWADLNGPMIKAANSRAAVPMIRDLSYIYLPGDNDRNQCIHKLLDNLTEYYELIYSEPLFMSEAAVARLEEVLIELGEAWMDLREMARERGLQLWKISSKVHKIMHTGVWSRALNVRFVQCYSEESQMGSTTSVWHESMRGQYAGGIQSMVLLKRTLALLLRLEV